MFGCTLLTVGNFDISSSMSSLPEVTRSHDLHNRNFQCVWYINSQENCTLSLIPTPAWQISASGCRIILTSLIKLIFTQFSFIHYHTFIKIDFIGCRPFLLPCDRILIIRKWHNVPDLALSMQIWGKNTSISGVFVCSILQYPAVHSFYCFYCFETVIQSFKMPKRKEKKKDKKQNKDKKTDTDKLRSDFDQFHGQVQTDLDTQRLDRDYFVVERLRIRKETIEQRLRESSSE